MAVHEPEWLNIAFIEKVLRKSENDDSIQVQDLTLKPATAKGDNYTSDMIRASVEYSRNISGRKTTEKVSLIVKISPTVDGVQREVVEKVGLFDTEIKMMETTLSKMNNMLIQDNHRLGARVLYTERGDPSLLVIEDLAPLGFHMADRQAGLNLDHCKMAMRGVAKFHATSVALVEKDPQLKNTYKKGIFYRDAPESMSKFFIDGLKALAKEVTNWPELGPKYGEKINKISESAYMKAAKCGEPSNEGFQVINHGDFWVNNMLFRYDDSGKVIDHIFVDFQLCLWTSNAIDLLYFLNTSPSVEVSLNHQDTLLEEYLEVLKETMQKLGCKTQPPTMADLKKSMRERAFYGVLSALTILPLVLIDKSEAKSLDEIMQQDGGYDNPAYRGLLYRKMMIKRIPEWDAQGLLDV